MRMYRIYERYAYDDSARSLFLRLTRTFLFPLPTPSWFFVEISDEVIFFSFVLVRRCISCSILCNTKEIETNLTFLIQFKEHQRFDYRSSEAAETRERSLSKISTDADDHFVTTFIHFAPHSKLPPCLAPPMLQSEGGCPQIMDQTLRHCSSSHQIIQNHGFWVHPSQKFSASFGPLAHCG